MRRWVVVGVVAVVALAGGTSIMAYASSPPSNDPPGPARGLQQDLVALRLNRFHSDTEACMAKAGQPYYESGAAAEARLDEAAMGPYLEALLGPDGQSGCAAVALQSSQDLSTELVNRAGGNAKIFTDAQTRPEYVDALKSWSDCMSGSGYKYDSPEAATADADSADTKAQQSASVMTDELEKRKAGIGDREPTEKELAEVAAALSEIEQIFTESTGTRMAIMNADAACADTSGLQQVRDEVFIDYLKEHKPEFVR